MTSPSRPAGLSGDAGPTPEPITPADVEFLRSYFHLEALVREVDALAQQWEVQAHGLLDNAAGGTRKRILLGHASVLRGLLAAVETLEKGTPE